MTTADGTPVTVKFDDELAVIEVEDGMGLGDPAPPAPCPPGERLVGCRSGWSPWRRTLTG